MFNIQHYLILFPQEFHGFRIVGFEIEPHSLKDQGTECADGENAPVFDLDANEEITFSYDIVWRYSEDTWAGRWERYVKGQKVGYRRGIIFWIISRICSQKEVFFKWVYQ